jgi:hypothetical protein
MLDSLCLELLLPAFIDGDFFLCASRAAHYPANHHPGGDTTGEYCDVHCGDFRHGLIR